MNKKINLSIKLSFVLLISAFVLSACLSNSNSNLKLSNEPNSSISNLQITELSESIINLQERKNSQTRFETIAQRMSAYGVPGMGIAIIQNGNIVWTGGFGVQSSQTLDSVDEDTVFSAGSVSKIINAVIVLRLVQEGVLNLDTDVNKYLSSWEVPLNKYTREKKVTLRMLLAHTSGFSQHGFPDFQPKESLPTALQTLTGQFPAKHDAVTLLYTPGSKMKYSGGGITVSQVLIEDVTGLDYASAAEKYVFKPLKMQRSTFKNPLPTAYGNIAFAHNKKGKNRALPRGYESMPEMAASGLWTSAKDMALFLQAILSDSKFLSNELRKEMFMRTTNSWHGLGPRINGEGENLVIHHGGANDSYKSWLEGHPKQKNGMIVLTNGEEGKRLSYEIRIAAGKVFGWNILFPEHFAEPSFE